jgi:hypothetical protein
VGEGDGLGDFDLDRLGEGLGELDLDGLGLLLLGEGLALWVWLGLVEVVGLREPLGVGLPVLDGLALADELALDDVAAYVRTAASSLAETTAVELCPQGEPIGRADSASAGAITKPDTRNEPATRQTAIRPARWIPIGTVALRSSGRPSPVLASDVRCYPRT